MKKIIFGLALLQLSGCVVPMTAAERPRYSYTETEDVKRIFVENALITSISSSTNGHAYDFYVELKGGSGDCANKRVSFTRLEHIKMGERLFELAKLAYLEKKTVTIGNNGGGNGCNDASFIVTTS